MVCLFLLVAIVVFVGGWSVWVPPTRRHSVKSVGRRHTRSSESVEPEFTQQLRPQQRSRLAKLKQAYLCMTVCFSLSPFLSLYLSVLSVSRCLSLSLSLSPSQLS